ncbi:PilC/PilY family type IV pilus protein [Variovorax ureilyticus]|uniref:PilC/PilY family type IV pilus protein n=1 Tax=Variovorax ureilyticus TaxID=1836198 RepID=A0ABU8V8J3_9BURK
MKVAFAAVVLLLAGASEPAGAAPTVDVTPDAVLASEPLFSTTSPVSSPRVAANSATVFIPQLDSTSWSGSLLAYGLKYQDGAVSRETTPIWNAGELLTGNPLASPPIAARLPSTRRIFTMLDSGRGVPFTWDDVKDDAALAGYLNAGPYQPTGRVDDLGADRIAYLRGDRTKETRHAGGVFRTRSSVMGDIVNSTPLLVGPADSRENDAQAVYVDANDGMLHAFGADSGTELFAYVPRSLHAKLGAYTSPNYVHQSFVDGSPVAGEVQLANGSTKTVLVSGMGAGARGVFALNVTEPREFSANDVIWEFNGDDDSDMGHVMQAPRIMKFHAAAAAKGQPATFAVVASGFNNGNAGKAAALFLLSLDKAVHEPWQLDRNYYKIVLPEPLDKSIVNALGPVTDYSIADNATRRLYAGDTQGNLWRFDFAKGPPGRQGALAFNRTPLMVAQDSQGSRQPITTAPLVGVGPQGGAIVLFGTGKLVEVGDLSTRRAQTLYGVHDDDTIIPDSQARRQLEPRRMTPDESGKFTVSGDTFAYGSHDGKSSRRRGWFFDLPDATTRGERLVSQMVLRDGYLLFNTLIPDADASSADGGGGHSCAVNAMTGLSSDSTCIPSTVGPLGSPLVIEEGDAAFVSTDAFGRRIYRKKLSVINFGAGAGAGSGTSIESPLDRGTVSLVGGRLNWRQVVNFKGARP